MKGKVCIQSYDERALIVNSIKYVDEVIPEESWEQKLSDIKNYNVDTFVIGDDWRGKFDFLADLCNVEYLTRTPGISTTERKARIIRELASSICEHEKNK